MKLLSVVFSFRNEESNLIELVKRTSTAIKKLSNWTFELIFVNDDSNDSSETILTDLQKNEDKTIIMVEQNAKKGLEFADIGYVLVSGQTAIAGKGDDLLRNPDVGRLFLGG